MADAEYDLAVRLEGTIDVGRMRAMNRAVDEEGRSPAWVARGFREGKGE